MKQHKLLSLTMALLMTIYSAVSYTGWAQDTLSTEYMTATPVISVEEVSIFEETKTVDTSTNLSDSPLSLASNKDVSDGPEEARPTTPGGGGGKKADTTAPTISAVTATQIQYNQATITWTTNEASNSSISYGLTTSYGNTTPVNTTLVTSHSMVLTGVQANTTYNYQVISCDKFNNCTTSGNFTFKTPVAPDTTAPLITAVTVNDINSGSATITWDTNEASNGLMEYWVTGSAKLTTTLDTSLGTSQSASAKNLLAGTTYNYRAKSCDAANNCTYSATLTFTTLPSTINTTTPVMTLNKPLVNVTNENQTFSVIVSGTDPQSDVLTYLITGNPTGSTFTTSTDKRSATFNWTPTYSQNGVYTITFHVSDGIETTAVTITLTVNDTDGPVVVGGIEVDQMDNNFTTAGYQIYEGSGYRKVTYSINASDPDQKVFNWSWSYKFNGGPEMTTLQGTGTVQNFTMDYGGQPGTYEIIFRGDDGVSFKSQTFTTEVLAGTWAANNTPTLFIDFDGSYVASWGSYANITTPRFDQDNDTSSFTSAELTNIGNILIGVIERFSIFGLFVTALDPFMRLFSNTTYSTQTDEFNARNTFYTNNKILVAAVGGGGSWYGNAGGVAYRGSFTNSTLPNYVFVFEDRLSNGNTKYTTEAISHEAGHGFGLAHQSLYSGTTLVSSYSSGTNGAAPTMGIAYNASRGLWWYGTTSCSTCMQDDVNIISNSANGFGFKADEFGNDINSASAFPSVFGTAFDAYGIINNATDADYFQFTVTTAGQVTFNATGSPYGQMLDIKLEIRDANGNVIVLADPSTFNASITANLSVGTYYLVVSGHGLVDFGGQYGKGYDVGQYWIKGTVPIGTTTSGAGGGGPSGSSTTTTETSSSSTTVSGTEVANYDDEDDHLDGLPLPEDQFLQDVSTNRNSIYHHEFSLTGAMAGVSNALAQSKFTYSPQKSVLEDFMLRYSGQNNRQSQMQTVTSKKKAKKRVTL